MCEQILKLRNTGKIGNEILEFKIAYTTQAN